MTMHMMGPAFSTTGKRKSKHKFKNSAEAARARANSENWNKLLEKYEVKPKVRGTTKLGTVSACNTIYRREPGTSSILSVDTRASVAAKKDIKEYTGTEMIGIGQLHKSNAIPIFRQEEAIDISKMRR